MKKLSFLIIPIGVLILLLSLTTSAMNKEYMVEDAATTVEFALELGCVNPETANAPIRVTPVGGTAPYEIAINGRDFFAFTPEMTLNVLVVGGNEVVIRDANGCLSSTLMLVVEPAPDFDISTSCPDENGRIMVAIVPNDPNESYQLSLNGGGVYGEFGDLNLLIDAHLMPELELVIRNENGCNSISRSITLDALTLTVNNAASTLLVCGEGETKVVVDACVDSIVNYIWSFDMEGENIIPNADNTNVYVDNEFFGERTVYVRGFTMNGHETEPLAINLYHYEEFTVRAEYLVECDAGIYAVSCTLAGGRNADTLPYRVDGVPITGHTWTSSFIPIGQAYFFVFDDDNTAPSCEPIIVQSNIADLCPCVADAGNLMPLTATNNVVTNLDGMSLFCAGTSVHVEAFGFNDNPGQTQAFMVTNGTIIVDITPTVANEAEFFGLGAGTYQLWALNYADGDAIIPDGYGHLNDLGGCFNMSAPIEFAVLDPIVIDASAQCTEDNESGFEIVITITGGLPALEGSGSYQINFPVKGINSNQVTYLDGQGVGTICGDDTNLSLGDVASIVVNNDGALCATEPVELTIPDDCDEFVAITPFVRNDFGVVDIYPIPATAFVTINLTAPITQAVTVELYSKVGQVLETKTTHVGVGLNQVSMDLSAYPAGIYFLTINDGTTVQTTKVMKQ